MDAGRELPLFDGGPTHRLMVRVGLARRRAPEVARGAIVLALFAWLPCLLFCWVEGLATSGVAVPFLFDFGVQARLLLALPLLVVAESLVAPRFASAAAHIFERGLVKPEEVRRFDGAVDEALRIRDSAALEVAVLVLAYLGAFVTTSVDISFGSSTWALQLKGARFRLTQAGIWNTFVALPLFQFLLWRWMLRLLNWWLFLFKISRLSLQLVPTHPDKAGGLGFLGGAHRALGVITFANGAVLSGRYCTEILHQGVVLNALKIPVAIVVVLNLLLCLGPLLMFAPLLLAARRKGLVEYGALALRYARAFDDKWLRGGAAAGEELLGSGDIQSLADMGGSFERIVEMRPVPFGPRDAVVLIVASLAPMVPILATVMPVEEVVETVLKIVR